MVSIAGTLETLQTSESEAQQLWYDRLGKALGFPASGSNALWTTSAEKFDGAGTTVHKLFPNTNHSVTTWLSQPEGAKQSIPLMSRVIGRTDTNLVFLAGLYGVNEATKTYTNKTGEAYVARNVSPEELVSAYNTLYPNLRTKMGRAVQSGEQLQLPGVAEEAQQTLDKLPEGYELTKKRIAIIDLINKMAPLQENLFEQTQQVMLREGRDKWLMTIIKPGKDGNPHFDKYKRDGFREFTVIAQELIRYMDRLVEQGNDSLAKVNEYFKAIAEAGDSQVLEGAIWMIRPPNNNKGIMEVIESLSAPHSRSYPTGWQTEITDFNKSTNWMDILKRPEMAAGPPPDDEEEEDDDDKSKFEEPPHKDAKGHVMPFTNEPKENWEDTEGNIHSEADFYDSPYGEGGEVNYDYDPGCCEQLKQWLVGIVQYKRPEIHLSEIERKVYAMPCHELNEYMEPPQIEDSNNFHNLKFFGVQISSLEPHELEEAIGLNGSPHQILWKQYDDCIEGVMSMGVIKPPSERTDPPQSEHWTSHLRRGEDELVEATGEAHREFQGFEWDRGEPGKFDYTSDEAMRETHRGARVIEGQDKEWEIEGEGQKMSEEAYRSQVIGEPTKQSFLKLYDLVNNKGRDMMDPKIRTDAGMTQKQFDNALQNWDEYKRKWRDELPR